MRSCFLAALVLFVAVNRAHADGPADNNAQTVRRIPKIGIEIGAADREALETGLKDLNDRIAAIVAQRDAARTAHLPDIRIYANAVRDAIQYREFFSQDEIAKAKALLEEGAERAEQLAKGETPWLSRTGLVVRGYVSKIDGSVQPYGLVIPRTYSTSGAERHRLDVWFHGRGEVLSEVNFLDERRRHPGLFTPNDTIVLHPYGRYCNAFKFAGEIDVLEAIDAVRAHYRIDDDRISVRGFSMGGAACWQFAVHYADRWFAAAPGAGFSETPRFLNFFQKETLNPPWYERKLWHMYDCTDIAVNLRQCPTVAYSGEQDNQKQAADVMGEALAKDGIELVHIIGPKTGHSYQPDAKREVDRRIDSIAAKGRERIPKRITFATYTLKYNRMNWVTIDALGEHWEKAAIDAEIVGPSQISVRSKNVTALSLELPPGWSPLELTRPVSISIDGERIDGPRPGSDRSWLARLERKNGRWTSAAGSASGLRKRHDLQGPIDDAFMDSFVFVTPTGESDYGKVRAWTSAESARAIEHWRRHFRGEARVVKDADVTDDLIRSSNLVLWGSPQDNAVLRRIADRLPITWGDEEIKVGAKTFTAAHHAVAMIYPNPLNPERYVVLNSGFTFRDYDYLNNARQVPKLPDWAIVDTRIAPDSRQPGGITAADFFGERWELRPPRD
jgi:hypothetical protein